jgi:glycosyltransferase involved in cell wall biosynthesis
MGALLDTARADDGISLGVVTAFPGLPDAEFGEDGVHYHVVGQPRRYSAFGCRRQDLTRCAQIVKEFAPDLLHIHGTERFYGLLRSRGLTGVPAVISLQGLMGPYATFTGTFGALSPTEILAATRPAELLMRLGLLWGYHDLRLAAKREVEILAAVDGVLGRTDWDRAYARSRCPDAVYHHVGELLRPQFVQAKWSAGKCRRHSIIFTNAGHPRRGVETLIEAVSILRREFPDISLRLAGTISSRSGYGRALRRRIVRAGLASCTEILGFLEGDNLVAELTSAHVFTICSYVENSPNSLAEAMMVGIPCVASDVGGIRSMIDHGRTGLLFPAGDPYHLADAISQVFTGKGGAARRGAAARSVALERHDPEIVVKQLRTAYDDMLSGGSVRGSSKG